MPITFPTAGRLPSPGPQPEDELADYGEPTWTTNPPPRSKKPSRGKWLGLALTAAVVVWGGIVAFTDTKPPGRVPSIAKRAPSASMAAPPSSSVPTGSSAEYLSADLPGLRSYTPSYGARYDAASGFFGPIDATVTRDRPGDYTIDLHNLGGPSDVIQIRASDRLSICYGAESEVVGVDERIHVQCVRLVRAFPALTTPIDSRFTVALIQPPRQ